MTNLLFCHHRDWMNALVLESRQVSLVASHGHERAKGIYGGANAVRNELGNRLETLAKRAQLEQDPANKLAEEQRLSAGKAYLERIQMPVHSRSSLEKAIYEWEWLQDRLIDLDSKALDDLTLTEIVDSGFGAFLDEKTYAEAQVAMERMRNADLIAGAKEPVKLQALNEQAELEWQASDHEQTEDREAFVRLRTKDLNLEQGKGFSQLQRLPPNTLDSIRGMLLEAQQILQGCIADFLFSKLAAVRKKEESLILKFGNDFGAESAKFLERDTEINGQSIEDQIKNFIGGQNRPSEPLGDLAISAHFKLELLSGKIKELETRLADFTKNPTEFFKTIERNDQSLRQYANRFGPSSAPMLEAALVAESRIQAKSEVIDPDVRNGRLKEAREWTGEVKNPNSEWNKLIQEKPENAQGWTAEKALSIRDQQEQLLKVLSFQEGAKKATMAIEALGTASSVSEMLKAVETELGKEHVELVSESVFDKKYRRYTVDGFMVFYQKGDAWRVIINKDALRTGKDPVQAKKIADTLKNELTHELRHLEFEKNKEIKGAWKKAFWEDTPAWNSLKSAFVQDLPTKKPADSTVDKKQYTVGDWSDEDVLSEIYAMQGEWARFPVLWAALSQSGILEKLGVSKGNAKDYASDDKEVVRGASEGAKAADEERGGAKEGADVSIDFVKKEIAAKNKIIDNLKISRYLPYVPGSTDILDAIKGYLARASAHLSGMGESPDQSQVNHIGERVAEAGKDLKKVNDELAKAQDKLPNLEVNPLREFWKSTYLLSYADFKTAAEHLKDYMARWRKKVSGINGSFLEMSLFENVPGLYGLELEAGSNLSNTHKEAIENWEKRLKSKDAARLNEIIEEQAEALFPDKHIVRACINILSENGVLNWRNPNLWKFLNKMQTVTYFDVNDPLLFEDWNLLKEKLKKALGEKEVYSNPQTFNKIEKTNSGNWESKVKEHIPGIKKSAIGIGKRLLQLNEKFDSFKRGKGKNIDSSEYEALIEFAIDNGVYEPEFAMFYLILGMAKGILPPDRGMALIVHMDKFPMIEWFGYAEAPKTQTQFQALCGQFADEARNGCVNDDPVAGLKNSKFMKFLWTNVLNHPRMYSRMQQKVKAGGTNFDHDWSRYIASLGDATMARTMLQGSIGKSEMKATQPANMYAGILTWMEMNAKAKPADWKSLFVREIAYFGMFESILCGAAYQKKGSFIRGSDLHYDQKPREGDMSFHKEFKLGDYQRKIIDFIKSIDPRLAAFFEHVFNPVNIEGRFLDIKSDLAQWIPEQTSLLARIETIDGVYDNMETIIKALCDKISVSQFEAAMSNRLKY
jgi:hypothetical protein